MSNVNDDFIYFFIVSSCNLMMEIVIKVLQIRINLALNMILKLLSQQSLSFFANWQQIDKENPIIMSCYLLNMLFVHLMGQFISSIEFSTCS